MTEQSITAQAPVVFEEVQATDGRVIAHAQLNAPSALNALNIEMATLLHKQLLAWQSDDNIAVVVLTGAGEKAFCAGGDVVAMYNAMKANPEQVPQACAEFFSIEYELDYLIHQFSKPFVVLGHGIIMGGGMGLFAGASHRVVTDTTRMAMPEITIGLFPDVGGSYFLSRMPDKLGLFLGLSGAQFNGSDAMLVGTANHAIPQLDASSLVSSLSKLSFDENDANNHPLVTELLNDMSAGAGEMPQSNIESHRDAIDKVLDAESSFDVIANIKALSHSEDKWLSRAGKTLSKGSPITMRLVIEQLEKGANMSLLECFKMELNMACECSAKGEFQEGVRALLIDKDGQPNWLFDSPESVPDEFIAAFFAEHWQDGEHPLSHIQE